MSDTAETENKPLKGLCREKDGALNWEIISQDGDTLVIANAVTGATKKIGVEEFKSNFVPA